MTSNDAIDAGKWNVSSAGSGIDRLRCGVFERTRNESVICVILWLHDNPPA